MERKTKTVKGKGWKKSLNIDSGKYAIVASSLMKVLTKNPIRFTELVEKAEKEVVNFQGSFGWYCVSVLRQLEREGRVIRDIGKVTTYRKSS